MYKKTPKTKKGMAILFVMLLMAVGLFGLFMGSAEFIPAPWLSQFIGIVCVLTSMYIMFTKIFKELVYEVCPTDREMTEELKEKGRRARYDFVISQNKGIREIPLCRIGLEEVKEAVEVNRFNRKQYREEDKNRKKYAYDTQFAPYRHIRVLVNENTVIYLTYDEELLKILNK